MWAVEWHHYQWPWRSLLQFETFRTPIPSWSLAHVYWHSASHGPSAVAELLVLYVILRENLKKHAKNMSLLKTLDDWSLITVISTSTRCTRYEISWNSLEYKLSWTVVCRAHSMRPWSCQISSLPISVCCAGLSPFQLPVLGIFLDSRLLGMHSTLSTTTTVIKVSSKWSTSNENSGNVTLVRLHFLHIDCFTLQGHLIAVYGVWCYCCRQL